MSIAIKSSQKDYQFLLGKNFQKSVMSAFDLLNVVNEGISKSSLDTLISHLGITKKQFVENTLDLSIKTVERKNANETFDRKTSSHILEVTKVVKHAFDVFESEEGVQRWLNSPVQALNNMKPLDLFYSPTGLSLVDNILTRIEEGVYS